MKEWIVSYNGNTCVPVLRSENTKVPYPALVFEFNEKQFSVEFDNRSDYMAARDSQVHVPVMIITANRSKRFKGTIIHKLKQP